MYRGKYSKRKRGYSKLLVLLSSVAVIMLFTVGGALSYLFTQTGDIQNTFEPANVSCAVIEEGDGISFDGKVKTNIPIKNTGNVDAYIRAAVVVNWTVFEDGKYKIVPRPEGYGHKLELNDETWFEAGGYYYFTEKVSVGEITDALVKKAYPTKGGVAQFTPSGNDPYFLRIDIIADAVQADPATTVGSVWPSVKANSDGLLVRQSGN